MPNWQAIFATNERRKLLRNSGWLLTDKLMRTAVGVVVSVTVCESAVKTPLMPMVKWTMVLVPALAT